MTFTYPYCSFTCDMEVESKCERTFCDAHLNHDHAYYWQFWTCLQISVKLMLSVCDHKMSFAALQVFLNF